MTIINLYKVTQALMKLLRRNITMNLGMIADDNLTVTAIPPERVVEFFENPTNTLSLFLYHVIEDPYYKNVLGPGSDVPNVAKTPMALSLFYILTAHHEVNSDFDVEAQQNLMGYALKTFHDFPVITDETAIAGETIFEDDTEMERGLRGKNNTIQITMRSLSPEESITFWSSEDTRTARLSAYYEVRVVMLDPEPPKTFPGIVLNLGTYLLQLGSPHLETSQSLVLFQLPIRNGGIVQGIIASPARITVNNSLTLDNADQTPNQLILLGTNLTVGLSRSLVLKNRIWDRLFPPLSDNLREVIAINLAENEDWQIELTTNQITITVAPTLTHIRPNNSSIDLPLLPGLYTVLLQAIVNQQVINGELKQIFATSNEIVFAITPGIIDYNVLDNGMIDINLDPSLNLLDDNQPIDEIQVIVAGEVYTRTDDNPPASAQEFFILRNLDSDPLNNLIRINPHFRIPENESMTYPFRLIVNGAESAPFWIEFFESNH